MYANFDTSLVRPARLVFFFVLISIGATQQARAATIELPPSKWVMISAPTASTGATLADLVAEHLDAADFLNPTTGSGTWYSYQHSSATNNYSVMPPSTVLNAGSAIWLLQITNSSIFLDLPSQTDDENAAQSIAPLLVFPSECASDYGCFEVPLLVPSGSQVGFSMVGAPYRGGVSFDDIVYDTEVVSGSVGTNVSCLDGCSVSEAGGLGLTIPFAYTFTGETAEYGTVSAGEVIPEWLGFWAATIKQPAGVSARLLLPYTPLSTITGRLTTPDGGAVSSVDILFKDENLWRPAQTTTAADGTFSLPLFPEILGHVSTQSQSHSFQITPVTTPPVGASTHLELVTLQRGQSADFDSDDINYLSNTGAKVVIDQGLIHPNGSVFSGPVSVTLTSVDVSNPATIAAFPGRFFGEDINQETSLIESLGTVEFMLQDGVTGEKLQLAPGTQAEVEMPMYSRVLADGTQLSIGDRVPLWSLSEDTGEWLQEGTGEVIASSASPTGLAVRALVSHFSWWNLDYRVPLAKVAVTLDNGGGSEQGSGLIHARVNLPIDQRPRWLSREASAFTYIGRTRYVTVPANMEICFRATFSLYQPVRGKAESTTQCTTLAPSTTQAITLLTPAAALPLSLNAEPDRSSVNQKVEVFAEAGEPVQRVRLYPESLESSVSYSVSGAMPPGIVLEEFSETVAELAGIPTQAGIYETSVVGANADSETDSIVVTYNVLGPPKLQPVIDVEFSVGFRRFSIDLNTLNLGALPVTQWQLAADGSAIPSSLQITSGGVLSVQQSAASTLTNGIYWQGRVTAINADGSANALLRVFISDAFPPLPE